MSGRETIRQKKDMQTFTKIFKKLEPELQAIVLEDVRSALRNIENAKPNPFNLRDRTIALIDEVETYWLCHPFSAITTERIYYEPVHVYDFSLGENAINPALVEYSKEYEKNLKTVGKYIPNENKELCLAWDNLDGLHTQVAMDCERIGYYVGVLMGAKLMGATRAQLEQFCHGLEQQLYGDAEEETKP